MHSTLAKALAVKRSNARLRWPKPRFHMNNITSTKWICTPKKQEKSVTLWKKPLDRSMIDQFESHGLMKLLDIHITDIGEDYLQATMPITPDTHQPMGLLHGGASVALAETVGSIAGLLAAEDGHVCVGLQINANHVAKMTEGTLTATARPLHIGRKTQVWDIQMHNDQHKLICVSRLTLAVLHREGSKSFNGVQRG
ncbi:MAG: hotdog fold thioesterase [Myxococcota bacterium]